MTKEQAEEAAQGVDEMRAERVDYASQLREQDERPGAKAEAGRLEEEADWLKCAVLALRAHWPQREALEAVEHPVTPEGGDMGLCAACSASEIRDHASGCLVGAALALARKEP
jgi:hypothetical protein